MHIFLMFGRARLPEMHKINERFYNKLKYKNYMVIILLL